MRKPGYLILVGLLALALVSGCCANPNGISQARQYMQILQAAYYTTSGTLKPQIHEMAQVDDYVALGAVLADQALMLAGALQAKYCAEQTEIAQLKAATEASLKAAVRAGQ